MLHLKVARTSRRREAGGVMYFSAPFGLEACYLAPVAGAGHGLA
jgi:hypothetical protein